MFQNLRLFCIQLSLVFSSSSCALFHLLFPSKPCQPCLVAASSNVCNATDQPKMLWVHLSLGVHFSVITEPPITCTYWCTQLDKMRCSYFKLGIPTATVLSALLCILQLKVWILHIRKSTDWFWWNQKVQQGWKFWSTGKKKPGLEWGYHQSHTRSGARKCNRTGKILELLRQLVLDSIDYIYSLPDWSHHTVNAYRTGI